MNRIRIIDISIKQALINYINHYNNCEKCQSIEENKSIYEFCSKADVLYHTYLDYVNGNRVRELIKPKR